MKMIQVVNALPSLQKLAGQDLSIKKLYKISKLLGSLEGEVAFYNDQRMKILNKYCNLVGDQYVPKLESENALNAELNELFDTEIEHPIVEVSIGCDEDIKLSYNDIIALQGFVRIEGEN